MISMNTRAADTLIEDDFVRMNIEDMKFWEPNETDERCGFLCIMEWEKNLKVMESDKSIYAHEIKRVKEKIDRMWRWLRSRDIR